MSEVELTRFGKSVRRLGADKRVSETGESPFIRQLAEARAEWRRRHPPKQQT